MSLAICGHGISMNAKCPECFAWVLNATGEVVNRRRVKFGVVRYFKARDTKPRTRARRAK